MRRLGLLGPLLVLLPRLAAAQSYDPNFAVELSRGQVVAPSRIVGMGGAFVSIAEGAGAYQRNPAAFAIRSDYNKDDLWDWDFAIEALVTKRGSDLENNRRTDLGLSDQNSGYGALGFMIYEFGLGVAITGLDFQQQRSLAGPNLRLNGGTVSVGAGYNLMDGQLVGGMSLDIGIAGANVGDQELFGLSGVGVSAGGVVRPKGERYRFGFQYRSRVRLTPSDGAVAGTRVQGLTVPPSVVLPQQLTVGFSASIGARARNRNATFGHRDPEGDEVLPDKRERATFAIDLVLTERLGQTAGFQAWAADKLQRAGTQYTVSVHTGIEAELFENRLVTRLGFYYEPSRFGTVGRPHGTAGVDLRLFKLFWDWRVSGSIDLARQYRNIGISAGFWH